MSSVLPVILEILTVVLPHSHFSLLSVVMSLVLNLITGVPSRVRVVKTSSPFSLSPKVSLVFESIISG